MKLNELKSIVRLGRTAVRPYSTIVLVLFCLGCHTAHNDGGTGTIGPSAGLVVFSSELLTGGGAFEFPGSENQSLVFNDRSGPISERSIRYSWNGQPVSNPGCAPNPTHNFAGFDLMHTAQQSDYLTTPGRDLRKAGYTKVTFFARGSLSSNTILKVEVAGDGGGSACGHTPSRCLSLSTNGTDQDPDKACGTGMLTSNWQLYTIPVPNSELALLKDFFKASFIFTDPIQGIPGAPGQGGTVYFDQILYQP